MTKNQRKTKNLRSKITNGGEWRNKWVWPQICTHTETSSIASTIFVDSYNAILLYYLLLKHRYQADWGVAHSPVESASNGSTQVLGITAPKCTLTGSAMLSKERACVSRMQHESVLQWVCTWVWAWSALRVVCLIVELHFSSWGI